MKAGLPNQIDRFYALNRLFHACVQMVCRKIITPYLKYKADICTNK